MSTLPFTHLHLHTEYSLLDGANKISNLMSRVKELGMESVAMTDHGNMFGAIDFYQQARDAGLKPLIGMEGYLHNGEELNDKSTKQRFPPKPISKAIITFPASISSCCASTPRG